MGKERDKKCSLCGRFYRGEGYKDVCTSDCYSNGLLAKKRKKAVRQKVLYEKPLRNKPGEKTVEQKANENWLKEKKPVLTPKQKRRIGELLESKHCRHDEWSGKPYRTVRG